MKTYHIDNLATQFPGESLKEILYQLLTEVHAGETIVLEGKDNWAMELLPVTTPLPEPRIPGSAKGQVQISDDFAEVLDCFVDYMA